MAEAAPPAVTAGEAVAGHVTLDISCTDRLYLNGYVPRLQAPGGVIYFFHDHRGKPPRFSFTKEQRRVSVSYVYIWDEQMGSGFIKTCTYFPYPLKAWVNGHERAKRRALAAGTGFTELSNGFASCEGPAALQEICDRFGPGHVQAWFERWMARLPLPLTPAGRPSAPPGLTTALGTLDQLVADHVARARVPTAA